MKTAKKKKVVSNKTNPQQKNVRKRKTSTTPKTRVNKKKKKKALSKPTAKSKVSASPKTSKKNVTSSVKYKCYVCTKSFSLLKQLMLHMNKWHCSTQATYDCEYCDSSFCQRMTYFNHLLTHYKKRTHSYRYSSLDLQNTHQLKKQLQSGKGGHKQMYTCFLCLASFNDKVSLKHHKETSHINATIFKCNVCLRQFVSKKLLEGHMKWHRVRKQHQCSMCAQKFNRLAFLFQHLAKHAQRVVYRCQYCSRLFSTQMLLHKHRATHAISWDTEMHWTIYQKEIVLKVFWHLLAQRMQLLWNIYRFSICNRLKPRFTH